MASKAYCPNDDIKDLGTSAEKWDHVYANTVHGNLDGTAAKATQDKNGNDIPSTYATKNELAGYSLVNGVPSFTYTV